MQASEWIGILNVLIAFLGVLIVAFAAFEWWQLRRLRQDFENIDAGIKKRIQEELKATHRVIAGYQVADIDSRISLLESAVRESPTAFNGFNALGFAYLEKGKHQQAIDAFTNAVNHYPNDKAGYIDLAYAHHVANNEALSLKYLRRAVEVDSSARDDILNDCRFSAIRDKI